MVNAIPLEVFMPSTKCEGLSYPTHFLKSRGSLIRNNVLEYSINQATLFARQNDFYALFASNKAKHIKLYSLFLIQNICCGYSKEPSQRDGSFEHPKTYVYIDG